MSLNKAALEYHSQGRPGKLSIQATKPCATQYDLSLAYSPGVAAPCLEIEKNPGDVYKYTNKGNLVAVISNGTAVLGLGNIGAAAGKPVMEGKGVLFKEFADVDVFDLEVNETDPEKFVQIVKALEPTFGGINLEDIKAPECFYIEKRLIEELSIPVFHDDQHGTAIISTAGLLNALEITGKKASEVKVVFSGAGAAGIACAHMFLKIGVKRENIWLIDRQGIVTKDRKNLEAQRGYFAQDTQLRTLADAMKDADVFMGLSEKDLVSADMLKSMAPKAIVFAMANPDPEIKPELALATSNDIIMATGRSDYPNQVNNVLGFPFVFRGALDVGAKVINEEMKLAASKALANLARQKVPLSVCQAYKVGSLNFGPEYIIPKPLDPRVLLYVAPAVAKAAMDSGVATRPITDFELYKKQLLEKLENKFEHDEELRQMLFGLGEDKKVANVSFGDG